MKFDKKLYAEAIKGLKLASEEADQADAILLDLDARCFADVKLRNYPKLWTSSDNLTRIADDMVHALESAKCDDCGVLMSAHGEDCKPKI
jgi:hypothetical protein